MEERLDLEYIFLMEGIEDIHIIKQKEVKMIKKEK